MIIIFLLLLFFHLFMRARHTYRTRSSRAAATASALYGSEGTPPRPTAWIHTHTHTHKLTTGSRARAHTNTLTHTHVQGTTIRCTSSPSRRFANTISRVPSLTRVRVCWSYDRARRKIRNSESCFPFDIVVVVCGFVLI